jgi:hypothetical protein
LSRKLSDDLAATRNLLDSEAALDPLGKFSDVANDADHELLGTETLERVDDVVERSGIACAEPLVDEDGFKFGAESGAREFADMRESASARARLARNVSPPAECFYAAAFVGVVAVDGLEFVAACGEGVSAG